MTAVRRAAVAVSANATAMPRVMKAPVVDWVNANSRDGSSLLLSSRVSYFFFLLRAAFIVSVPLSVAASHAVLIVQRAKESLLSQEARIRHMVALLSRHTLFG